MASERTFSYDFKNQTIAEIRNGPRDKVMKVRTVATGNGPFDFQIEIFFEPWHFDSWRKWLGVETDRWVVDYINQLYFYHPLRGPELIGKISKRNVTEA
jgi:hypothetical protein